MAETHHSKQYFQELTIHLVSGNTLKIRVQTDNPDSLNRQFQAFFNALGHAGARPERFVFRSPRLVLVRLSQVAAAESETLGLMDQPASVAPACDFMKNAED